jgi:hypothetical protein
MFYDSVYRGLKDFDYSDYNNFIQSINNSCNDFFKPNYTINNTDVPKYTLDSLDRDSLHDRFSVVYNKAKFDCLITPSQDLDTKSLFVIFSGSRNISDDRIPIFKRWSFYKFAGSLVLNIADPMFYDYDKLSLGWYYGKKDESYIEYLYIIIKKICGLLNIDERRLVLFGSSGGGYVALQLSMYFQYSIHVAINPQININKYYYASEFETLTSINLEVKDVYRRNETLDIVADKVKNKANRFLILQNLQDKQDCINHLFPLIKVLGVSKLHLGLNESSDNLLLWLYSCIGGHNTQGDQLIFSHVMYLTNKILNSEVITCFDHYLIKNISVLWKQIEWFKYQIREFSASTKSKNENDVSNINPDVSLLSIQGNRTYSENEISNTAVDISLFKRGFILFRKSDYPSADVGFLRIDNYHSHDFKEIPIADTGYDIFIDNNYNLNLEQKDEVTICAIGTLLDTQNCKSSCSDICKKILDLFALNKDFVNNEKLLDYLDYINGRYVVFILLKNDVFVFNDACGLRSVYYHKNKFLFSSHYNLLNLFANEKESEFFAKFQDYKKSQISKGKQVPLCLPGNLSPLNNICLLVCNHVYQTSKLKQLRFFPRVIAPEFNFDQASSYISDTIKTQLSYLADKYQLIQGLTNGIDSRLNLAAAKDIINKIFYYAYSTDNYHSLDIHKLNFSDAVLFNDVSAAEEISNKLKLNFKLLSISKSVSCDEASILSLNHYHNYLSEFLEGFKELKIPRVKELMHLRTEISKILRKSGFSAKRDLSGLDLAKQFTNWSMIYDASDEIYPLVVDYYQDFINEFNLNQADLHNYNVCDIFYIEHRLNQWLSSTLIQQDPIADSFALFNTRKILTYGMNIPKLLKDNSIFTSEITDLLWSDLKNLNQPNSLTASSDLVDYDFSKLYGVFNFDLNVNRKRNYQIFSGSQIKGSDKSVTYVAKPKLTGISFGFSSNIVSKGEYIYLSLSSNVVPNSVYYLELNIFSFWHELCKNNEFKYEILLNNKIIYQMYTNTFSRPNQITCIFNSGNLAMINIKVRLLCVQDSSYRDFNGLIVVRNIIIRKEYAISNNDERLINGKCIINSTFDYISSLSK